MVPVTALALAQPLAGPVARLAGLSDRSGQPLVAAMTRTCRPGFLRWCIAAIAGWQPSPVPTALPIYRLHGGADVAIRPAWGAPTTIVPRAGHLLDVGHASAVITWLEQIRQRTLAERERPLDGRAP